MKKFIEPYYPKEKLNIIWVTDGLDDATDFWYANTQMQSPVHHLDARKIGAMNRGMAFVKLQL
jgi:hypothetical protein